MSEVKRSITIYGATAEIKQPYAEGQTMNAAEAKALNQCRAEGVGNNTRSQLKKLLAEGEKELAPAQLADAVKLITDYDAAYELTLAAASAGRSAMSPIEKEAKIIATNLVKGQLRKDGKALKDVDKERLAEVIATTAEREDVLAAAKRAVAARSKVGIEDLELDLG